MDVLERLFLACFRLLVPAIIAAVIVVVANFIFFILFCFLEKAAALRIIDILVSSGVTAAVKVEALLTFYKVVLVLANCDERSEEYQAK